MPNNPCDIDDCDRRPDEMLLLFCESCYRKEVAKVVANENKQARGLLREALDCDISRSLRISIAAFLGESDAD